MAESRVEILTPEEGENLRRRIRELESELADLRATRTSKSVRAREEADDRVADRRSGHARANQYKQVAELLDATADAIVSVDKSGAISSFNRGAEAIFGFRSSEIIGRPLDVLIPERFRRSHRSHIANFSRAKDRSRLMNERGEIFGLRKNGDEFPAEASIVRLESGAGRVFTVILRDITERKAAETARQRSEEQFRDLIEGSIQGVLIHRDFKPVFANRAIADIFGYRDAQEILALGSLHSLIAPDEREKLEAIKEARMENREAPAQYEFRGIRKDGSAIWLENRGNVVRWDGEPAILSVMVDVTDRHEAQAALEERERQLRTITDNLPAFIAYTDRESRLRFANSTVEKWYGDERERLLGKHAMELLGKEEGERLQARTKQILEGKTVRSEEQRTFPDGASRYVDNTSVPNIAADGQVKGWFTLITDITERKLAEEAIRQREEQLRAITDNIPAFIVYIDSNLRYRFANRVAEQWYDRPGSELVGRKVHEVVGQGAFEILHPQLRSVLEGKAVRSEEIRHFPDGSQRHVDMSYVPDVSEEGQVRGFFALLLDISGRRQAEDALRRSVGAADLLRQIATAANEAASAEDAMSCCLEAIGRYGGWDVASVFVLSDDDSGEMLPTGLWWANDPGSFADFRRSTDKTKFGVGKGLPGRIAATAKPAWIEDVRTDDNFPRARMRGRLSVTSGFGFPVMVGPKVAAVLEFFSRELRVRNEDLIDVATQAGTILGRVVERQRAEWSRRDREERMRLMADNVPVLITYIQPDKTFGFVNRTTEEWYGQPAAELTNCPLRELIGNASYKKMEPRIDRSLAGETLHFEEVLSYPDGRTRNIDATYVPHVGERGEIRGVFTMVVDITDRIQAEERLRQSQRMEAIGKLTGGIAHDFNNLLAVITGNAEIVCDHLRETEPAVKAITEAANRGAELTRRLLAFSRQQPLRPQPTDLGKLTSDISEILSRTLGEAVTVEVTGHRNAWPASVDPHELENAILNLAINARDAMPSGGTLTLEPSNVTLTKRKAAQFENAMPGDYVRLAVSDSGNGMPAEVVEHAFEPFFTTKPFGTGSGLGLSMVYGFAIQSGGFATIESRVGEGTTVNLYLPRANPVDGAGQAGRGPCAPIKGGETILVVEDDPDVRKLTVTLLSSMGYQVLEAEDGEAAQAALSKARKIDLLLSDVVLPGDMSGPAIAESALEKSPSLPVLFMSGYAEDVIRRDREGKKRAVDAEVLTKPFTRRQLAEKIEAALGTKVR